jgi:hypothetical protein
MFIICYHLIFLFLFFARQILHWPLGITIACHCDLISIPAFFGSGNVAQASFPNKNIKKEDGLRMNPKYLCKNMRIMAIIAC